MLHIFKRVFSLSIFLSIFLSLPAFSHSLSLTSLVLSLPADHIPRSIVRLDCHGICREKFTFVIDCLSSFESDMLDRADRFISDPNMTTYP